MAIKKKPGHPRGIPPQTNYVKKASFLIATANDELVEASSGLDPNSKAVEEGLERHALDLFDYHARSPLNLNANSPGSFGGIR